MKIMKKLISRLSLFVIGIVINIVIGYAANLLIDRYDGYGMIASVVLCVIYIVVMLRNFYDEFIDECFFDKVLRAYLLLIMPVMTNFCYFIWGI